MARPPALSALPGLKTAVQLLAAFVAFAVRWVLLLPPALKMAVQLVLVLCLPCGVGCLGCCDSMIQKAFGYLLR